MRRFAALTLAVVAMATSIVADALACASLKIVSDRPTCACESCERDVVIYGSTPAAVTAAITARRMDKSVVIVSPETHVGGLTVSGLGFTDSGNTSTIGGLAREFYRRIYSEYKKRGTWRWEDRSSFTATGQRTPAICESDRTMWTFEPHVAEKVIGDWLAEHGIDVVRGELLDRGPDGRSTNGVEKVDGRIVSFMTHSGRRYRGRQFVDATYEGDLMAAAGVPYRLGREGSSEYGEEWNGNQPLQFHHGHHFEKKISAYRIPRDPSSGLCPEVGTSSEGVRGAGDGLVQAYCYRLCMTDCPENRIPFARPEGYDPGRYELLRRVYAAGYDETFAKFDRIPNRKTDTNNHGPFNADYIGGSGEWPEASYGRRAEIAREHRLYQEGLYYFIANDLSVPEDVRHEMSRWGLSKDEFRENGGWPYHLYVREGRRMLGEYVMTEHDCMARPPHPLQGRRKGVVAMGSYCLDSHNVRRYVTPDGWVQNEGDVGVDPAGPYPIDFGSIVPRRGACSNLIVPVALSASHIAFGSIRMEPVFFELGQAAGTAASQAIELGCAIQDVPYEKLRERLLTDGQILNL